MAILFCFGMASSELHTECALVDCDTILDIQKAEEVDARSNMLSVQTDSLPYSQISLQAFDYYWSFADENPDWIIIDSIELQNVEIAKLNGVDVVGESVILVDHNLIKISARLDRLQLLVGRAGTSQFTYTAKDVYGNVAQATVTLHIEEDYEAESILSKAEFYATIESANPSDVYDFEFKTILVEGSPLAVGRSCTIKNLIIKRGCSQVSNVIDTVFPQTDYVVLDNTSQFAIGDWTLPVTNYSYNANSGGQILGVARIVGDTIFTFQKHQNLVLPGARLINQFPLVQLSGEDNVSFENVVFDGSKDCNSHTLDWRYNSTVNLFGGDRMHNCTFVNTPSENVFTCGGVIDNCRAFNLNGSFVHGSCLDGAAPSTTTIRENYTNGVCLIPVNINGHNEGWFTYSNATRNFIVENNESFGGRQSCWGNQELDDYDNIFVNNYFSDFPRKKFKTSLGHPNPDDISNNTYINVPD